MSNVSVKYLKDENDNEFSPVTSADSVYNGSLKIIEEYIKGLSVSGKTITYTKGNGTTGTITTQDTTYSNATTSTSGLMSSADKQKLDLIRRISSSLTIASKSVCFLPDCYYNNQRNYGFTIRVGNSSLSDFVDDTYWLSFGVVSGGSVVAGLGVQINGASFPTWSSFL